MLAVGFELSPLVLRDLPIVVESQRVDDFRVVMRSLVGNAEATLNTIVLRLRAHD